MILLLAHTGLRWGEAAALLVEHVDLASRRVRVVRTVYEVGGVRRFGPPKSGKARTVAPPASIVADLEPLITGREPDELLFQPARGVPLRANNWRVREFNAAVAATGLRLKGLAPHKLRHTAVSLAIAAGSDGGVGPVGGCLGTRNGPEHVGQMSAAPGRRSAIDLSRLR